MRRTSRIGLWTYSFNLYINDVVNVWNKFKYVLFADDTILISCKTTNNVENIVNVELKA